MKRNNYVLCIDTKRPKNKMSNKKKSKNKTPKITHHPKTKRPMLQIVQKQNTQDNKKPKFTKCPKLQNVQNYKMS